MPVKDIHLKPGLYTIDTPRGAEGRWKDGDHVRWWQGLPQKIGGWIKVISSANFVGNARSVVDWHSLAFKKLIAFGTYVKLYVWEDGTLVDITPVRDSGTLANNPITTLIGTKIVTIRDVAHGTLVGDYVNFSGATAVGGLTVLGDYTVTTVVDVDNYTITHASTASSSATGGGAAVTYRYEINIGTASSVSGRGFGAGPFGMGTFGTPRTLSNILIGARTWTLDNWGEDLIANPTNLGIYVWDTSVGFTSNPATLITQAPSSAKAIFVSSENRHLVALGAHDGVNDNPMLIRWCSSEDYTDWTPTLLNTAGDKQLDQGNELLCAVKTKGETLIYSNSTLYSMTFDGPPYVFGFQVRGANGGIAGANAAKEFGGFVYWMADRNFMIYNGYIRVLDCEVLNHVFDDINWAQKAKVFAGANRRFAEVWWLYPSANSDECNRYVVYNTKENHWTFGTLDRTVFVGDSNTFAEPYGMGIDGHLYTHEAGTDDDTAALPSRLESGDIDLGEGESFMHIKKYIPDFVTLEGSMEVGFIGRNYPQSNETVESGPHTFSDGTLFANPRIRARQVALTFNTFNVGDNWRMGKPRIELIPHGKRG